MDFNLDVRLKQLESLEHYISSSRDKVQSVLDCLKWDEKEVLKESQLIKCSVDPNHRVHSKSVEEHVKNCTLRREGYELNEDFLSEPVDNGSSCITIDDHKKIEILCAAHRSIPDFKSGWNGQDPDPKTANRLLCTFSPDERLTLYSYAVKNTVGPSKLPEFNTSQPSNTSDKPLTYEELRIRERDAKRRRIKYKTVHTNRKSQMEVMREVINGQMEMYTDWLVDSGVGESQVKSDAINISKSDYLMESPMESTTNSLDLKNEYEQSYDERQKSAHSSATGFSERGHSVVSKNSTHSGSSRSTTIRKHTKGKHELNHRKRCDDRDYRRHHDSGSRERSTYKRRSRERCDYQKRRRSHSRHGHTDKSRNNDHRER